MEIQIIDTLGSFGMVQEGMFKMSHTFAFSICFFGSFLLHLGHLLLLQVPWALDKREAWNRQDIEVLVVFCESYLADTDPWVLGADHHGTHAGGGAEDCAHMADNQCWDILGTGWYWVQDGSNLRHRVQHLLLVRHGHRYSKCIFCGGWHLQGDWVPYIHLGQGHKLWGCSSLPVSAHVGGGGAGLAAHQPVQQVRGATFC